MPPIITTLVLLTLVTVPVSSQSAEPPPSLVDTRARAYAANVRNDQAALRTAVQNFERLATGDDATWAVYDAAWTEWALSASQLQDGNVSGALASLNSAAERLRPALSERESDPEFHAMMANILISLVSVDRARFPALVSEIAQARRRALELGPSNPRVVLMDAGLIFNNPPERGGGQQKGIDRWNEALRLFDAEAAGQPSSGPEPRWGRELAYGWFAQILLRAAPPRRTEAQAAARRALELEPEFWYVRSVVMPMLK